MCMCIQHIYIYIHIYICKHILLSKLYCIDGNTFNGFGCIPIYALACNFDSASLLPGALLKFDFARCVL